MTRAVYSGDAGQATAASAAGAVEAGAATRVPASTGERQASQVVPADGKVVLEAAEIARALTRITHEILERTDGAGDVVLLGIPTRGVPLAQRLAAGLSQVEGRLIAAGSLDVTMYRDDLRLRPARALQHTAVPSSGIDGKIVVLVDDVLSPAAPCERRSTLSATSAGRRRSSSPSWSTGGTASCPSGPTTWGRTCRRHSARWSRCC